jgi:hypothetical protein
MNAEIILKRDEKDYLLQMTADDSPARPILAEARPDDNSTGISSF